MIKNLTLLILSLLFFQVVKAQNATDSLLFYFHNNGSVSSAGDADYRMCIMPVNLNTGFSVVKEYYPNNQLKFVGNTSSRSYSSLCLEGKCINYFKNGSKKCIADYSKGYIVGDLKKFYPNDSLYCYQKISENGKAYLTECRDSTGKILAEKGKGQWIRFDDNFNYVIETGQIVNGRPDGDWKEVYAGYDKPLTFTYKKGMVITPAIDSLTAYVNGLMPNEISKPEFNYGGKKGVNSFLVRSIKFPAYDRINNVSGKVVATFIIEKDGSVTNIRTISSPDTYMAQAVEDALSLSPQWVPGTQNGQPVRVQRVISFTFSFASN